MFPGEAGLGFTAIFFYNTQYPGLSVKAQIHCMSYLPDMENKPVCLKSNCETSCLKSYEHLTGRKNIFDFIDLILFSA